MADFNLTLTDEECHALTAHLDQLLRDMLIEEHRTRTPKYREGVMQKERMLRGVLNKVREAAAASQAAAIGS
jgi:hypothetical protein